MKITSIVLLFISTVTFAQTPPGTEIYLLDIKTSKEKLILSNAVNVTNKPGYDNQPYFHPDKPLLYFTSANEDNRTDILSFNYANQKTERVTTTPEREYSPTVTPDKKFISTIIQRDNGAQDLGKYPVDGGAPQILLDKYLVGYHAWANDHTLITFVLGQPHTLHFYNFKTNLDTVVATNIGRSLHKIPTEDAFSFTQRDADGNWFIRKLNITTLEISTITPCLPGVEHDLTWTPDGKILMSDEKQLFVFDPSGKKEWIALLLPENFTPKSISRLAVNPKGNKLAIVVAE